MRRLLISYDFNDQHDHAALERDLTHLGGVRVLQSVWCLPSMSTSADSMLNRLKPHVAADERIIVVEFSVPAGQNLLSQPPA